jgi:serine/threonine protein phosphatase 1
MEKLQTYALPDFDACQRLIAIGDVHGQLDLLQELVEKEIQFNPAHDVLVFMGDYIDRGRKLSEERETVKYLIKLYNESKGQVVLLKGNHEEMAEQAILNLDDPTKDYEYWWRRNGGARWQQEDCEWLLSFCQALPLFVETEQYIFVHAGAIDNYHPSLQDSGVLLWERYGNQSGCLGKQLVVGHTPRDNVVIEPERICVDTGAFYTGKLSAYDLKNNYIYEAIRIKMDDRRQR